MRTNASVYHDSQSRVSCACACALDAGAKLSAAFVIADHGRDRWSAGLILIPTMMTAQVRLVIRDS